MGYLFNPIQVLQKTEGRKNEDERLQNTIIWTCHSDWTLAYSRIGYLHQHSIIMEGMALIVPWEPTDSWRFLEKEKIYSLLVIAVRFPSGSVNIPLPFQLMMPLRNSYIWNSWKVMEVGSGKALRVRTQRILLWDNVS